MKTPDIQNLYQHFHSCKNTCTQANNVSLAITYHSISAQEKVQKDSITLRQWLPLERGVMVSADFKKNNPQISLCIFQNFILIMYHICKFKTNEREKPSR